MSLHGIKTMIDSPSFPQQFSEKQDLPLYRITLNFGNRVSVNTQGDVVIHLLAAAIKGLIVALKRYYPNQLEHECLWLNNLVGTKPP
jgi:hypothetical protein